MGRVDGQLQLHRRQLRGGVTVTLADLARFALLENLVEAGMRLRAVTRGYVRLRAATWDDLRVVALAHADITRQMQRRAGTCCYLRVVALAHVDVAEHRPRV